jgi:hypothetical protein
MPDVEIVPWRSVAWRMRCKVVVVVVVVMMMMMEEVLSTSA